MSFLSGVVQKFTHNTDPHQENPNTLNDENVCEKLEKAHDWKDQQTITACVKYLLLFDARDPVRALRRFCTFDRKLMLWGEEYRTPLREALYTLLCQQNLSQFLATYFTGHDQDPLWDCRVLLQLFAKHDNEGALLEMVPLLHTLKYRLDHKEMKQIFHIFIKVCNQKNKQVIRDCFRLLRKEDRHNTLDAALQSILKKVDHAELMADLLQGALTSESVDLLFFCLRKVHAHWEFKEGYPGLAQYVEHLFARKSLERPAEVIFFQLVMLCREGKLEDYDFERLQKIQDALFFLSRFRRGYETFSNAFIGLTAAYSTETRRDLLALLLMNAPNCTDLYTLINWCQLQQDSKIKKALIIALSRMQQHEQFLWFYKVKEVYPYEMHPVTGLVREYLSDFRNYQHESLFCILQIFMCVVPQSEDLANSQTACLRAVDEHALHHLLPHNFVIPENRPVPQVLLKAVACCYEQHIEACDVKLRESLLRYVASRRLPENVTVQYMADLYEFAHFVGAAEIVYKAEESYFLKQKVDMATLPAFFKVMRLTKPAYRENLKNKLFMAAYDAFQESPAFSIKLAEIMHRFDKTLFSTLDLKLLFSNERKVPNIEVLKQLAPEIKEMNLLDESSETVRAVCTNYPALTSLTVDGRNVCPELAALPLTQLALKRASATNFQMLSALPVRHLTLLDFDQADRHLREALKDGQVPQLFTRLETFTVKPKAGVVSDEQLTVKGWRLLLPHLTSVRKLSLTGLRITDELLQLIMQHLPNLFSFDARISSQDKKDLSFEQLEALCKRYPLMQEFSLNVILTVTTPQALSPSQIIQFMRHFKSLKSVSVQNFDDAAVKELVKQHPHLQRAALCSYQITDDSLDSLKTLSQLTELDVRYTSISVQALLELAYGMKSLNFFKASIPALCEYRTKFNHLIARGMTVILEQKLR